MSVDLDLHERLAGVGADFISVLHRGDLRDSVLWRRSRRHRRGAGNYRRADVDSQSGMAGFGDGLRFLFDDVGVGLCGFDGLQGSYVGVEENMK